jgi:hypothetical protein
MAMTEVSHGWDIYHNDGASLAHFCSSLFIVIITTTNTTL